MLTTLGGIVYSNVPRPRPAGVEIIGHRGEFTMPSPPVAVLTTILLGMACSLVVAERPRQVAKLIVAVIVGTFVVARLYLAVDHPSDALYGVVLGVVLPLVDFRLFAPNEAFPVAYRRGKKAYLDVSGERSDVRPPGRSRGARARRGPTLALPPERTTVPSLTFGGGPAAERRGASVVLVAAGLAGIAVSALPLRSGRLGRREARAFRAVNTLPDWLFPPVWAVMQSGNFTAAPAAAVVAWAAGRPRLAVRLLEAGSATWVLAKVAKRVARRGRPASFLTGIRHRGKEAKGLGYLSGHAGVSMALAATAVPHIGRRARPVVVGLVPVVGLARIYVGAHLPLDVVGGAALGLAVSGALTLRPSSRSRVLPAAPPPGVR